MPYNNVHIAVWHLSFVSDSIIPLFFTYSEHNGMNMNKFDVKERRLERVEWIYLSQERAK
jgi:hypothetical protein